MLLEAGLSVHLIAPWTLTGEATERTRLTATRLRMPRSHAARVLHSLRIFSRALSIRAHSYHFHDLDFLPLAVLLRLLKGVPVIYDCHENYDLQIAQDKQWIPGALRGGLARFVRFFEGLCVRVLKHCIVPVPEMIKKFRFIGENAACIRNVTSWTAQRSLVHGLDVVYSGSISRNYGMFFLLDVTRALARVGFDRKLHISLRNASAEDIRALREAISKERLPITIHPQVPAYRIGELLSLGCIGLSLEQDTPEKRKAVPAKLFEYMAFGLPIVSTDNPMNREIINAARCGVVANAGDAAAFADAIMSLLHDEARLISLRENGFKALRSTYSWEDEKWKLVRYYSKILRRPLALRDRIP